jgi:spore coat polysaccharide biosynthesis protein SpsF
MKIALGSAQFGMDYGINNKRGKIPKEEVFKILKKSKEYKIDIIDTAIDYGESEQVIGEFKDRHKFKIITKGNVANVEESLKNLKVKKIYGYLIHHFEDFKSNNEIWQDLKEKKEDGKIEKIGFSLYYPTELEYLLKNKIIPDLVQVPYNIFDRRFEYLFNELKDLNVEIYVRSIFLQGLVFKKEFEFGFIKIKEKIDLLNTLSKRTGVPISIICINAVLLNENIDYAVLGVNGIQNFEENLNYLNYSELVKNYLEDLNKLREDDKNLIIPSNWEKIIEGKNIYLRELNEEDASEEYCNWLNDSSINKYLETKESSIQYLKNYIKEKRESEKCLFFGIFDKKNEEHIGNVKLEPIKDKKATFGILIGNKSYWSKGIGTEVTRIVIDYAFNELKLSKIDLGVVKKNKKAIRVYEKVGFKKVSAEKNSIKMEIKNEDYKKIALIVQARMGSTRFPGKMMVDLIGKPVIWHVLKRVKKSESVDKVILATSNNAADDILESEAKKEDVVVFRGSENDVLDRYYQASRRYNADIIVRVTGDCPLIDPEIIDDTIRFFIENKCDYVSNTDPPTFPDGMDVEVFSFDALKKAYKNAKLKSEREHVTPFIKKNKNLFKIKNLENEKDLSKYRLTLDEKEDLIVIKEILEKLENKDNYSLLDIINVLESNKEILEKNKKFGRNEGYKKSLEEDEKK